MDFETVYNFGKRSILTFEIELVNLAALVKLEEGLVILHQNKTNSKQRVQKIFYTKHNIPTAAYGRFNNLKSLIVDILDSKTKLPFVWKCTEFG
jgi:5-(carboxyamino)imidazole ribonucleotide synthase